MSGSLNCGREPCQHCADHEAGQHASAAGAQGSHVPETPFAAKALQAPDSSSNGRERQRPADQDSPRQGCHSSTGAACCPLTQWSASQHKAPYPCLLPVSWSTLEHRMSSPSDSMTIRPTERNRNRRALPVCENMDPAMVVATIRPTVRPMAVLERVAGLSAAHPARRAKGSSSGRATARAPRQTPSTQPMGVASGTSAASRG